MKHVTVAVSLLFLLLTGIAWAEHPGHPGVVKEHRDAIQNAMGLHILELTELNGNGSYPIFDPETRSLLQLEFKNFHDSVEIKGRENSYFVSCADFMAEDGTLYDIDFFVSKNYGVVSALIHSKNGQKTPYDVH